MKIDPYREFWRRHHRVFGLYLVTQAWQRGLDCIALSRKDVDAYLMLKRVEKTRLQWLREDLEPWFKYQVPRTKARSKTFHSLYLSRVELPPEAFQGILTMETRIEKLQNVGIRTGALSNPQEAIPIKEDGMIPYLAGLAAGLQNPRTAPTSR